MEDDCSDDYDDEHTQLMHDKETRDTSSVVDQKKTVVAQVPVVYNVEGGGHTILFAQQVTVQVGQMGPPPSYTPQYGVNGNPSDNRNRVIRVWRSCRWLLCSCFIFLMSVVMIIPIAVVGVLSCTTLLSGFAISGLGLGSITLIMSIVCCAHCFNPKDPTVQCLCCSTVSFLTLVFLATLIATTVFAALDVNFINESAGLCLSTEVAPVVLGFSYFMLLIFGLFSLWSIYTCCKRDVSSAADTGVNYLL